MDDLAGLEWSSSTSQTSKAPPMSNGNYYPVLRPTPPVSGRSTPAVLPSKPPTGSSIPAKTPTPANDSFASLVSASISSKASKSLSLQEQQKLLQEQRTRQLGIRSGHVNADALDALGSRSVTPNPVVSPPTYSATSEYGGQKLSTTINKPFTALRGSVSSAPGNLSEAHGDLLAAFNADAPVDASTNFPIPNPAPSATANEGKRRDGHVGPAEDDDLFGLDTMSTIIISKIDPVLSQDDDDDVLGLLGKPVSELPPRKPPSPPPSQAPVPDPQDHAIAELVEMGFSAEKSREALTSTESGTNVQAAVGWLLNQAHAESRSKTQTPVSRGRIPDGTGQRAKVPRPNSTDMDTAVPAWMRQQDRSISRQRREDDRSPASGEKDAAQIAAEIGNNIFKTANSLWKTGTKKINKAVADLNIDVDPSQPRWMRESQPDRQDMAPEQPPRPSRSDAVRKGAREETQVESPKDLTDEAMMLESGGARPQQRQRKAPEPTPRAASGSFASSRDRSPALASHHQTPQPRFSQQQAGHPTRTRLSRLAVEEENAQAYVSPARRKKTTPRLPSPEPDLLFGGAAGTVLPSKASPEPSSQLQPRSQPRPQPKANTNLVIRPKALPRTIPPLSSIALESSTRHRLAGTAAFKLGNYADANVSYTAALGPLPSNHPLTILLHTNRALTHIKTGDPKACIVDADAALALIGPSRGIDETVPLGGDEGTKDMAPFWGKAMTRRAEALEQLEKWDDAARVWKECVEAGVGGATSIQGRNRCDKAAGRVPPPSGSSAAPASRLPPAKKAVPTPKPPVRSALADLSGTVDAAANPAEAVFRLRAANAAAARAEDEKFALADSVHDRVTRWRKGKEGNLRALLGSLETVLWEGSGWTKVSMGELIVPKRVKVVYVRAVARCHPDKLPTTATTEQVMISGAVFSVLNEAWDGFRKENGL